MKYDFSRVVDRFNTASMKWDQLENLYGSKDLISLWLGDMDFLCPEPIVRALAERVSHGIYGYTTRTESYLESIGLWMQKRHNWTVDTEWLCHSPGVVPGIGFIINAFTNPGDTILIQPPVYYPFSYIIKKNQREVVQNPLRFDGQQYNMDFEDLRQKARQGAKMLVLCSPHNPVGRVWRQEELTELGKICLEHDILVVSDEIHSDLVYKPNTHIPFASISPELAMNCIVCTSPSKSFNLAGLQTSTIIIPNPKLRQCYNEFIERLGLMLGNTFGVLALETAYRFGYEWLEQLIDYLNENLEHVKNYFANHIPNISVIEPEGTYFVWLDCRELKLDIEELAHFMRTAGGVALDDGHIFGTGGEGFERINIACPRLLLEKGVNRIERAVKQL